MHVRVGAAKLATSRVLSNIMNNKQGLTFSADDVLEMTRKTRELLPTIPLSVTVPHTLDLDEQVRER